MKMLLIKFATTNFYESYAAHLQTGVRGFQLEWAGALKDLSMKYTSVSLQKKAMEWRGD